jgi:hypothetical protein
MRTLGRIVAVLKHPAEERAHTENREVVRRDDAAIDANRVVRCRQTHGLWIGSKCIDIGQRLLTLAIVSVVRIRGVVEAAAILRASDVDEARRLGESWQRSKEQRARD